MPLTQYSPAAITIRARGPRGATGASGSELQFATRTAAIAATISGGSTFLRTAGYYEVGDAGGALYKKSVSEPSHAGKFQSADGAWWELTEYNAVAFGADPAGGSGADSLGPFQDMIDATPDATVQMFRVPRGEYAGDMSTLEAGDRHIILIEEGGVTYPDGEPDAAPGIQRFGAVFNGFNDRPWLTGTWGIGNLRTNGLTSGGEFIDRPTLAVQRYSLHDGGNPLGNFSNFIATTIIGADVRNYENAVIAQIVSDNLDDQAGSGPNFVCYGGGGFKNEISRSIMFGANYVARDQTTRSSSVSRGGLVGAEIDTVASGPDDGDNRSILDVIARPYAESADGDASIGRGINVKVANLGVLDNEPLKLLEAIIVEPGSLGSIGNAFHSKAGTLRDVDRAIYATGEYQLAAVELATTGKAVVKLGTANASGITTEVHHQGTNSASEEVSYVKSVTTISTATDSAEVGKYELSAMSAGADTIMFRLFPANDADNPVSIFVAGALRKISRSASQTEADSGFRILQVSAG